MWWEIFKEELGERESASSGSLRSPCHAPEASLLSLQFQSHQIFHVLVVAAALQSTFSGVSACRGFRRPGKGAVLMTPSC